MRWYERAVLGVPILPVVAVLALTGWLAGLLQDFKVDASSDSLIIENDPDLFIYEETRLLFSSDEYVIVACHLDPEHAGASGNAAHPSDAFSPEGIAFIDAITKRLAAVPDVRDVQSIANVPLLRSGTGPVNPMALMQGKPTYLTTPGVEPAKARAELTGHALLSENLLSTDGRTVAFVVMFDKSTELIRLEREIKELDRRLVPLRQRPPGDSERAPLLALRATLWPDFQRLEAERKADRRRIVGAVRAELAEVTGERGVQFYASGIPIIVIDMVTFIEQDMVAFGIGSAVFMGLVLFVIFRRWRWTVLPVLTCGVVVVWILGLLVILDKKTTVVTSNLSSLLFIVGMAHSIHLVVKYREVAAAHPELGRRERVLAAMRGIVAPCLFTAMTTMVGFASLAISRIPPVVDFGYFMTLGIALAFGTSFVFFPAALALLPVPKPAGGGGAARLPWLGRLGSATLRGGWWIGLLSAAMFVYFGWGATRIEVETKFIDYFKKSSALSQGLNFIDNELGGTTPFDVVLQSAEPNHFLRKDVYPKLAALHAHLEDETVYPEIGKVMSPVGVGAEFAKLAKAIGPLAAMMVGGNPATMEPVELQRRGMLAVLKTPSLRQQVDVLLKEYTTSDFSRVRVVIRARETMPGLKRNATLTKIRQYLQREMPEYVLPPTRAEMIAAGGMPPERPGLRGDVTGVFILYTNMLNSLIVSQVTSFWVVFAGIWGMIGFFFHLKLWQERGWALAAQLPSFVASALLLVLPMLAYWAWALATGIPADRFPPVLWIALLVQLGVLVWPAIWQRRAPARVAAWDGATGFAGAFFLTWRALLLALLAMLPNLLPVIMVLGLMGWTGIRLDLATIMVASVSLGIAVDDTIHYIYRYREEQEAGGTDREVVVRAHETIGQAILYTSVAIVGGFWVLVLSNFKPTMYFGLFTGAAMFAAVFGSLTLLPLLLVWFRPMPPVETGAHGGTGSREAGETPANPAPV